MSRSACEVCGETYDYCGQCGTCHKCMGEDIDRLKAELEDAKDEAFKREARIMMYVNKNSDIKRQLDASQALLAEARAEIERLSSPDYYACAMCPDIKEARQEAARECIKMVKRQAPPLIAHSITAAIMTEFVLEG